MANDRCLECVNRRDVGEGGFLFEAWCFGSCGEETGGCFWSEGLRGRDAKIASEFSGGNTVSPEYSVDGIR